jgi:antitoxin VapB
MTRTSIFQTNRTQAVRLPKDVAFPDTVLGVTILREGVRRVIVPNDALWDHFFASPGADLGERDQPMQSPRESF